MTSDERIARLERCVVALATLLTTGLPMSQEMSSELTTLATGDKPWVELQNGVVFRTLGGRV